MRRPVGDRSGQLEYSTIYFLLLFLPDVFYSLRCGVKKGATLNYGAFQNELEHEALAVRLLLRTHRL